MPRPRQRKTRKKAPARKPSKLSLRLCRMCKAEFQPVRESHYYCKSKCRSRDERNADYFDGHMAEAVGWTEKQCQACWKVITGRTKMHIHHVYGHPDHSRLVVLCAGCHELVTKMSWRKMDLEGYERLIAFAFMQKMKRPYEVDLEIVKGGPIG